MTTLHLSLAPLLLSLIILLAIAGFSYLFIRAGYPVMTKESLYYKLIASGMFILLGLYDMVFMNSTFGGVYERHIMTGLFVSWFGDICWSMDAFLVDKPKAQQFAYALGGVFYVSANMFYIVAFLKAAVTFGWWLNVEFFVVVFLLFAACLVIKQLLGVKYSTRPMAWCFYVYTLMLCLLVTAAGTLAFHQENIGICSVLLLVGPLLYLVSNGFTGLKYFKPERYDTLPVRVGYITSYYLAQILIATTIAFVNI